MFGVMLKHSILISEIFWYVKWHDPFLLVMQAPDSTYFLYLGTGHWNSKMKFKLLLFLFRIFSYNVFWSYFPLPNSSLVLPILLLIQLHELAHFKKTRQNRKSQQRERPVREKIYQNQTKSTNTHTHTYSHNKSILCWSITLGHGTCSEVIDIPSVTLL